MKANIFSIVLISFLLISVKGISNEEFTERDDCTSTTAYLNFTLNVTDDNPSSNFYYLIRYRVETLCPSTSAWFYDSYNPYEYSDFSSPITVSDYSASNVELADDEETYYFYLIRAEVLKFSGTFPNGEFVESRQGTSYAARSGTSLTAYDDIDIDL